MTVKTFMGRAIFREPDVLATGLANSPGSIRNLIIRGILEKPIKDGDKPQSRKHWTAEQIERAFERLHGTAAE